MADLSPDYSKRDYLLPPGCRDLIDVLNLTKQSYTLDGAPPHHGPKPKYSGQAFTVELKTPTTVKDLAEVLHVKPFRVIAALMELGVFANVYQVVDFDTASKLLAKYGLWATRAS
jgi:hypothetical protein